MKDDHSLGVCVGLGAQMINGCTNNPFTVLAKQVSFKKYKSYSDLFFLFYPCLAELSANYISHLKLKIPNTISSFKFKKKSAFYVNPCDAGAVYIWFQACLDQ